MIFLKIAGSLMIIMSCSIMGYSLGGRYTKRVNHLMELQNCISILEMEIIYSAIPLPQALEDVHKKGNKVISYIFSEIRDYLIKNKRATLLESFESVSNLLKEKLCFEREDIEVFLSLGRVLGASDRVDQQKHFKMIMTQLKVQQHRAEEKRIKNEKMYRNLGIMTGLAITIILF